MFSREAVFGMGFHKITHFFNAVVFGFLIPNKLSNFAASPSRSASSIPRLSSFKSLPFPNGARIAIQSSKIEFIEISSLVFLLKFWIMP